MSLDVQPMTYSQATAPEPFPYLQPYKTPRPEFNPGPNL